MVNWYQMWVRPVNSQKQNWRPLCFVGSGLFVSREHGTGSVQESSEQSRGRSRTAASLITRAASRDANDHGLPPVSSREQRAVTRTITDYRQSYDTSQLNQ